MLIALLSCVALCAHSHKRHSRRHEEPNSFDWSRLQKVLGLQSDQSRRSPVRKAPAKHKKANTRAKGKIWNFARDLRHLNQEAAKTPSPRLEPKVPEVLPKTEARAKIETIGKEEVQLVQQMRNGSVEQAQTSGVAKSSASPNGTEVSPHVEVTPSPSAGGTPETAISSVLVAAQSAAKPSILPETAGNATVTPELPGKEENSTATNGTIPGTAVGPSEIVKPSPILPEAAVQKEVASGSTIPFLTIVDSPDGHATARSPVPASNVADPDEPSTETPAVTETPDPTPMATATLVVAPPI